MIGLILIVMGWLYFYYLPVQLEIVKMESEIKLYKAKIQLSAQFKEKIPSLYKQVTILNREIAGMENRILNASSIDSLVLLLNRESSKYKIRIKSVSPVLSSKKNADTAISNSEYQKLFIEVIAEAEFLNFAQFLEYLDDLPFFMNPKGIKIIHRDISGDILKINLLAEILFKPGIGQ